MNYFNPKSTAERYSMGRPYFHIETIERIRQHLKISKDDKLERVLDIACGIGLSTKALKKIGNEIIGTDSSNEMLYFAQKINNIEFVNATAENQPFDNQYFDLITVSSGIHWFEINGFLKECNRLLKQESRLVIYDNFFISEMVGEQNFKEWFPKKYLAKYPSPPRNSQYDWSSENLKKFGFKLVKEERFKNQVEFSKNELILYFTTQSNITNEVNRNGSTYEEIELWLYKNLKQYFKDGSSKRTFKFGNWIKYLKKINPSHDN